MAFQPDKLDSLSPSPDRPERVIRVTKDQLGALLKRMFDGVTTSGGSYNGLLWELNDNGLEVSVRGGAGDHFGIDAILIAATGVDIKNYGSELLFTGGEVLKEGVIIDVCPVSDDGVWLTIGDLTSGLMRLKSAVPLICGDPREPKRQADMKEYLIDHLVVGDVSNKAKEVERQASGIMARCIKIVETSMADKSIEVLSKDQKFAPYIASFMTSALSYHWDNIMKPAYLPGLNHQKIDSIRQRGQGKIKSKLDDHLRSISVALESSHGGESKVDMDLVSMTGSLIGESFVDIMRMLHTEAERSMQSFQESSSGIVGVVDNILDAYIDTIGDELSPKTTLSSIRMSGGVIFAEESLSISGASQIVESVINGIGAMQSLLDGVDVADDGFSDQGFAALWERTISSVQGEPQNEQGYQIADMPNDLMDGLGQVQTKETEPETGPEQHENFKATVRGASLSLIRKGHFADAAKLLKVSGQTKGGPGIEAELNKVYNLSTAMGALNARWEPANWFSTTRARSNEDRKPFFEATVIVSGELQEKYKKFGVDRISIPVNRDLPIMYNHLKLLRSIDSTVVMYSMSYEVLKMEHGTFDAAFGGEIEPLPGKGEKMCVMSKFNDVNEIPRFFEEVALAVLGVSIIGTVSDPRKQEDALKGLAGETSTLFSSDSSMEAKFGRFDKIVNWPGREQLQTPKALSAGSEEQIRVAIAHDVKVLGIIDTDKMDLFVAFCKLYRAASVYDSLQKAYPSSGTVREASYYNTGVEMARMIKSGVLEDYGHLITAAVRSNDFEKCPYGLKIPLGCQNAGNAIDKMKVIGPRDSERAADDQGTANKLALERVMRNKKACTKCKYARSFMKSKSNVKSVVCNYGEANAGADSVDFEAGVGGSYPNQWYVGLFSTPTSMGPSDKDSYMARQPGTSPWGYTPTNTSGM